MEKIWVEVLKRLGKHRWIFSLIVAFAVAYWLHEDEKTWANVKDRLSRAYGYIAEHPLVWMGVSIAVAGYLLWMILVRKSHKDWQGRIKAFSLPKEYTCRGDICNVHLVMVRGAKGADNHMEVQVENLTNEDIVLAKGRCFATVHKVRVYDIPFKALRIRPAERAIASNPKPFKGLLDDCDALLSQITTQTESRSDVMLRGPRLGYSLTELFKQRPLRALWPLRNYYDLYWLENRLTRDIPDTIRYRLRNKTHHVERGRRIRVPTEVMRSVLVGIPIVVGALALLALTIAAMYGVGVVLWQFGRAVYQIGLSILQRTFA